MDAGKIYEKLEKDFIKPGLSDEWFDKMGVIKEFITPKYKKCSMGLVCDFAQEINKVYTAVFPSDEVMKFVLSKKETNVMLLVHHPMIWDMTQTEIFHNMSKVLLQKFKERKITIYNLHVPLDNFGEYSTSGTLAKALGIKLEKPFAPYFGSLAGVFGKTDCKTVEALKDIFERAVGHRVKLLKYGTSTIRNGSVALIAGGGNDVNMLKEIAEADVNTFVTGITIENAHSQKAHEYAKKHKINILGGTHYSTEKFACIALCDYFEKLGLPCEFIDDKPSMEDL